jgi:hypothetical protein
VGGWKCRRGGPLPRPRPDGRIAHRAPAEQKADPPASPPTGMPCSADPCSWRSPAEEHFTWLSCFGATLHFSGEPRRRAQPAVSCGLKFSPRDPPSFQVDVTNGSWPRCVTYHFQVGPDNLNGPRNKNKSCMEIDDESSFCNSSASLLFHAIFLSSNGSAGRL